MKLTRREFLKALKHISLFYSFTAIGGYSYATRVEPHWLAIERVNIPIKGLKSALEGTKIVAFGDIHLHPYTEIEFVRKAVEMVNQRQPDLVVLLGDYVLENAQAIFELAPILANIKAKYGTYAIMGNHDLWTDAQTVQKGFHQVGIPMLINAGQEINIGGDRIYLAGLDDGWSGRPDLEAALAACPANLPVILLMHEPDFIDTFAQDKRVSLQISGHSHGGQVRLPGIGSLILPRYGKKYDQGLYLVNETWLYVNRGLGVGGLPVRFNCRPEITEIALVAS